MTFTTTLFAFDLLTGNPIGQIPYRGLSFGGQVNAVGTMSFDLDPTDPRIQNLDFLAATAPLHACIVVDYDKGDGSPTLPYAYMVTRREPGRDSTGVYAFHVEGMDLWQFIAQQVQATDYSSPPFSGITGNSSSMPLWNAANLSSSGTAYAWDPMLMAAQVLHDSLTVPNTDLLGGGIEIYLNGFPITDNGAAYLASGTATPSADYVAEAYPFTSLQTPDTIVQQLSQLGYLVGFDFGVDTTYTAGQGSTPFVAINLSYPLRGRSASLTHITVDVSTALAYAVPEDGAPAGSTVFETGGNQDIVAVQNIYAIDAGYPSTAKVVNRSQLNSANVTAILTAMGRSDLRLFSFPLVAPTVTLPLDNSQCAMGAFIAGDDVSLVVPQYDQDGNIFDPRFPAGLDAEWRITSWVATVSDQGVSTLALTLDTPPSATRQFAAV